MSCCSTCQNVTCQCSNGVNGKNIWTITTANFTQPLAGNQVTIFVSSTQQLSNQGFGVGQVIYIETGGYYEVISIASLTSMTIENLGYTGNAAPASNIASGSKVSPGGLIGPTGPAGTPAVNGTTLLHNDNTVTTTLAASPSDLKTYVVSAGELANDGDALKVEGYFNVSGTFSGTIASIAFRVGSTPPGLNVVAVDQFLVTQARQSYFEALISRKSDTQLNVTTKIFFGNTNPVFNPYGVTGAYAWSPIITFETVTVADMDSNPFSIVFSELRTNVADTINAQYLTVEKLTI